MTLAPPAFAGGVPDQFTFAVLDSNLEEVSTTDPLGTNVLLRVEITSPNPAAEQFRLAAQAIPEPTTFLLLGAGLAGIGGMVKRRRQAQAE